MVNLNKYNLKVGDIVYRDTYIEDRCEIIRIDTIFATIKVIESGALYDIMVNRLTKI
jgi:hypothetical protein